MYLIVIVVVVVVVVPVVMLVRVVGCCGDWSSLWLVIELIGHRGYRGGGRRCCNRDGGRVVVEIVMMVK